jgi:hypothetical protein
MASNLIYAQRPAEPTQTIALPKGSLPIDSAKTVAAINSSYYHPDDLAQLNCDVSVNWDSMFKSLKLEVPADRLKIIQGLKLRSQAARGKAPEFAFDWTTGSVENKQQVEDGFKQMISGYYEMYWSSVAAPPVGKSDELKKLEPMPDGGTKAFFSNQNSSAIVTLDSEHTPTSVVSDTPIVKSSVNFHYKPSPKPVPGDLRRLADLDISAQMGTSTTNVTLGLDYQQVDGFNVPKHVSFNLVGAFSLEIEFSSCSIAKTVPVKIVP